MQRKHSLRLMYMRSTNTNMVTKIGSDINDLLLNGLKLHANLIGHLLFFAE
eukprot:m.25712 g.25712  ORF g.25712 m.25712 type:complete len:51 (-) comp11623_c0_seq1:65-217(-)